MTTRDILIEAKKVKPFVARLNESEKNAVLNLIAQNLLLHKEQILKANETDMQLAKEHIAPVMLDRLRLDEKRINDMAQGVLALIELPDPIGEELERFVHENSMVICKIRVPMGVIAMIYESRPNVTADAAALCLKSGNACILRGGKEAINTNKAIVCAMQTALKEKGHSPSFIQLITDTHRQSAQELMRARGFVDLLIPRGGAGLIRSCVENAQVPCIETGTGICHVYVDESADINMAVNILTNAKTSRPSVCNSAEVCLVHENIAQSFLPEMEKELAKLAVELRICKKTQQYINGKPASEIDFNTEFLDYILAVKIVPDVQSAVTHINEHGTGHSDCIVAQNKTSAEYFTKNVDSAAVYVNASTRFSDGGVFGLGCEIGISTQKLGARGPMGLKEITSYKYCIDGSGQIRA